MKQKIVMFVIKRKITVGAATVLLAVGGGFGFKALNGSAVETRYVLAAVEKGTLITSVTGSGQISVSNQVDVKSKGSGDALSVAVKNGQEVKAGAILAQLNARDALKTVRDAQANLASARLALEKLKKPAGDLSLMQAENALTSARNNVEKLKLSQQAALEKAEESKQKAEDNLVKAYEDAFSSVSDAFLDLPTVITELHDILYSQGISSTEAEVAVGQAGQQNIVTLINTLDSEYQDSFRIFQIKAESDYADARLKYDANFEHYTGASRYSDRAAIESLLVETLETTKALAEAAKSESNYLDAWADYRTRKDWTVFAKVKEYQDDLAGTINQTNGHLSSLLSIQRTLQDNREAIAGAESDLKEMAQNNPLDLAAAEATVKEREATLANLKAGTDALDIQSQELAVRQRLNALSDAREKLADYAVRAPFDGVIANVAVKKGDSVSAGAAVATLITKQRLAEISLNEVDVAKVAVGQKATLTFDAIEDLTLTGEVAEIDALGTVTQGVVSYTVTIFFDTQDERVKPGMSVSAAIITDMRQDALLVPNGAVKTQGGAHYVEMFDQALASDGGNQGVASAAPPRQRPVEIGLSNDTSTEIVSGLAEGDQVVARTITPTASKSSAQQTPSLFGAAGGTSRSGGVAPRM